MIYMLITSIFIQIFFYFASERSSNHSSQFYTRGSSNDFIRYLFRDSSRSESSLDFFKAPPQKYQGIFKNSFKCNPCPPCIAAGMFPINYLISCSLNDFSQNFSRISSNLPWILQSFVRGFLSAFLTYPSLCGDTTKD